MSRQHSLAHARNLGQVTERELNAVGIHEIDDLRQLGWEEAFARWAERYPKRLNLNAAAALIGAIDNTDWRRVPSEEKERARKLIAQLKRA